MSVKYQSFDANCFALLRQLSGYKSYHPSATLSKYFRPWRNITHVLLTLMGALFFMLLALAGCQKLIGSLPTIVQQVAFALGMGVAVFGILSLIIHVFCSYRTLRKWQALHQEVFTEETNTDLRYARACQAFGGEVIALVEIVLTQKVDRLRRRAAIILGEKFAVFSLAVTALGLVVSVMKILDEKPWMTLLDEWLNPVSWQWVVVYVTALLGGLAFGAVGLRRMATKYEYQLELLALAKELPSIILESEKRGFDLEYEG